MENLNKYAVLFDKVYPRYAGDKYTKIQKLTEKFKEKEAVALIKSEQFALLSQLLEPLIEIKNYKTQVPFPRGFADALVCCIGIKQHTPSGSVFSDDHKGFFKKLISMQGFDLPTVSAVFHFCHPNLFPIVDRNVQSACKILKEKFPKDFEGLEPPLLPRANTSQENKLNKYNEFIKFISKIKELQDSCAGAKHDYRFIDKALMVLGVEEYRKKAENE